MSSNPGSKDASANKNEADNTDATVTPIVEVVAPSGLKSKIIVFKRDAIVAGITAAVIVIGGVIAAKLRSSEELEVTIDDETAPV